MNKNTDELLSSFNSIQTPVFGVNEKFDVVCWNQTLESYSSIRGSDIISQNLFDFFPHLNNPVFILRIEDLFNGSPPVIFSALLHKFIIPCKLPNGEYRVQHTTAVLYKNNENNNSYALFTIKDVTEEARQINNYKKMRDVALVEVEQRKISEAKLIDSEKQLKIINADKDRFFSIISHDLKSPFVGLIGYSEMIATDYESFSTEELKSMMNDIYQISKNTFSLLQNLLDWSRIQTGKMEITFEKLNLLEMTKNIISLLELNARQKSIHLIPEIDENLTVFADEDMLKTVIRNLVSNAIKFTNSGGRILISAGIVGEKILISVTDDGVGMTEEVLDKLFRIDVNHTQKGTNEEEGTGLGLILCQEMIKKHNSEIRVESQIGNGSRFYFELDRSI